MHPIKVRINGSSSKNQMNHVKSDLSTTAVVSVKQAHTERVLRGGNFLMANLNLQDGVCGLALVGLSGRFLILPLTFI